MRGDAWGWSPHKICIFFHPHGKSLNDFSTLVSVPTQNSTWVSIPTQNSRLNSVEFRLQSPSPRKISPWYLSPRKLRTSAPVPTQNSDLPWVSETGVSSYNQLVYFQKCKPVLAEIEKRVTQMKYNTCKIKLKQRQQYQGQKSCLASFVLVCKKKPS